MFLCICQLLYSLQSSTPVASRELAVAFFALRSRFTHPAPRRQAPRVSGRGKGPRGTRSAWQGRGQRCLPARVMAGRGRGGQRIQRPDTGGGLPMTRQHPGVPRTLPRHRSRGRKTRCHPPSPSALTAPIPDDPLVSSLHLDAPLPAPRPVAPAHAGSAVRSAAVAGAARAVRTRTAVFRGARPRLRF